MKIGLIGTGIMGSRMAANLLKGGHALTVHNRTRAKAEDLLAQGAQWAETPAALAPHSDCVVTMLSHPQAVESAALDAETGFLDALPSGATWPGLIAAPAIRLSPAAWHRKPRPEGYTSWMRPSRGQRIRHRTRS